MFLNLDVFRFYILLNQSLSNLNCDILLSIAVDSGSDTWEIVEKSGGGFAIPPEDP